MSRTKLVAAASLTAALLLSGCGAVAEKATEKATEKALESGGDGKVDIDTKNGTVKVETKDGTFTSDENGAKVESKDGDSTFSAGDTTTLPEGWPDELAPPDGTKLLSSSTIAQDGKDVMAVLGEVDGSVKDVYTDIKNQLEGAGFELSNDTFGTAGSGSYGAISGKNDTFEATATISSGSGSDAKTTVSMSLTPLAG